MTYKPEKEFRCQESQGCICRAYPVMLFGAVMIETSASFVGKDVHDVRKALAFSTLLGSNHFKDRIEKALSRSVGYTSRERPKTGWVE